MNHNNISAQLNHEREKQDRFKIIKYLKKKKYQEALDYLSRYQNRKLPKFDEGGSQITEYFLLIHSGYAHFQLNRYQESRDCLNKILSSQPLDGQANLLLAYIDLLEGNETRAIHRYTILLENPFYLNKAIKILDNIRSSNSITDVLVSRSVKFFYQHELPDIMGRIVWEGISKSAHILGQFLTNQWFSFVLLIKKYWRRGKTNSKFLKRNIRVFTLLFFLFLLLVTIIMIYSQSDTIKRWKKGVQEFFITSQPEIAFSASLNDLYGDEKVLNWISQYQEMKNTINSRRFNLALKIYYTINQEPDVPIEVKNKFYILSTFITNPRFEEVPLISSFAAIDPIEFNTPIGLYYRFRFKVLRAHSKIKSKFLVKLSDYKPIDSLLKLDSLKADQALLYLAKNNGNGSGNQSQNNLLLQIGREYEAIAQIQGREKNYWLFKTLVVRILVKSSRE